MAAVRMEDSVLKDWRFRALAQRYGLSKRWAWGLMLEVYSECTERNSEKIPAAAIDVMGQEDGLQDLSTSLVACALGEPLDGGLIRIKGCRDDQGLSRIDWLHKRRNAGRRGGLSKAANVANAKQTSSKPVANAKQTLPSGSGSGSGSFSKERETPDPEGALARAALSLDEDVGPDPDPDQTEADGSSPSISASPQPFPPRASVVDDGLARRETTVFLEWFNRRVRRGFNSNGRNVDDVHRLLTRAFTQGDLRLVARHLKHKWAEDEKMRQHLVPSAILNGKKFAERLDDARATHPDWAEAHRRDDAEAASGGGIEVWERWADEAQLRSVP